jgi:hypothetical protein
MTTPSETNQALLKVYAQFLTTVAESQRLIDEHDRWRVGGVAEPAKSLAGTPNPPNGRRPLLRRRAG